MLSYVIVPIFFIGAAVSGIAGCGFGVNDKDDIKIVLYPISLCFFFPYYKFISENESILRPIYTILDDEQ